MTKTKDPRIQHGGIRNYFLVDECSNHTQQKDHSCPGGPESLAGAHAHLCHSDGRQLYRASHVAPKRAPRLGDVVKMVIPSYKPKSYSISELQENEFDVTLKVYPNGRASGYLDQLRVGGKFHSFGKHCSRSHNQGSYVGIIAYGVGITEGLPVARAELEKGCAKKVVLLWASRTMADTFWNEQIEELKKTVYPETFQIVYILSREEKERDCLHGRINPAVLSSVFDVPHDERDQACVLSVGTKEMMKLTDAMPGEIGYPMLKHWLLPKPR
jgi:NAD(P)H-flavin reductase